MSLAWLSLSTVNKLFRITFLVTGFTSNAVYGADPVWEGQSHMPCSRDLKLMSFNLRYDFGTDAAANDINGWNNRQNPRRARVKSVLDKWAPDIIGTQEGYDHQIQNLKADHPYYDFWGVGRDDGRNRGEYAGIFYRRESLRFQAGGHFWLSETPEKPGTTFPTEGNNRMASWVRLEDRATGNSYLIVNTHWGLTEYSRQASADLMVKRLGEILNNDILVILGDLNTGEMKRDFLTLKDGMELNDSFRLAHPEPTKDEGSYHGFTGNTDGQRIDHILIPPGFDVLSADIVRDDVAKLYPSDHFPVQARICFAN